MIDYFKGTVLLKETSANIDKKYPGTHAHEDAAQLLWVTWLDGPVSDFVSRFGVALVPNDLRKLINDVERGTGRVITAFGPDEGGIDDYVAYLAQHHSRIVMNFEF